MPTEKRTSRQYTEDFERDAVALVTEQGYRTPLDYEKDLKDPLINSDLP